MNFKVGDIYRVSDRGGNFIDGGIIEIIKVTKKGIVYNYLEAPDGFNNPYDKKFQHIESYNLEKLSSLEMELV